ncbi:O-antigen ligase family protein [Empedobacter brevis]|uniref:O-antigen ligase family protein n=1 Tax=Empedobacter brevis TaxID=247 RepID=A0AAJ1QFW0_9FLAO|nr:O-antigen ligase family protein [Empedobacter brevis]MDM1073321.1 O-antigen ligase family protein [Empedobacter brevis]
MKSKFNNLYIILLLVGFLISSFIPSFFGIKGDGINVIYRVIVLGFSLILIFFNFLSERNDFKSLNKFTLFFIFWGIYSLFLLNDIFINQFKLAFGKTYSEYLQFAFGVVLLPAVALIFLDYKKINFKLILNSIYYTIYFFLLLSLIKRSSENISGRELGDLEIGILIYGQYGTMLSLLSVYKLIKEKINIYTLVYILGLVIGILVIFVSESRSPFIALILSIIYFFVVKRGTKGISYLLIIFSVFFLFLKDIITFLNSLFQSRFFERLVSTFDKENAREGLIKVAFNEFLDNPFFGKSIVIQTYPYIGSYPHNLFIEVLMSSGFFVACLLVYLIMNTMFVKGKMVIKKDNYTGWVPMLFFQFFVFSMFSNNIYSNNLLWHLLILTIITYKYEKYNITIYNNK